MSLLMKALEKAAKDRGEARGEIPATSTGPRPEVSLALELLAADTPSPRIREEPRPDGTAAQRTSPSGYRNEASNGSSHGVRAGTDNERGAVAYLRDRPLIVFGVLAGMFALAFGAYVYVQIFHPGLLLRQQPAPPALPPRVVETPPTAPAMQPIPTANVLNGQPSPLQPAAPVSVLQSPVTATTIKEIDTATAPPKPVAIKPAEKSETPTPRNAIVVKRSDAVPTVNPTLANAYAALQAGRMESAAQLYAQLLRSEPRNADVLLGLAALAVREGRNDDAAGHYRAILEIDPRHALAQSGLIALTGRADPIAAETHLKQLIARDPSAFLFFTLGNLYADQSLWAPAQQAYFQAHHLEPDNPDYAYNLAVGLEHISQPRLALGFYRRAVELSDARPQVNFDPARARQRINILAAQVH